MERKRATQEANRAKASYVEAVTVDVRAEKTKAVETVRQRLVAQYTNEIGEALENHVEAMPFSAFVLWQTAVVLHAHCALIDELKAKLDDLRAENKELAAQLAAADQR